MAEVLELPQLPQAHGVAEVDVRRRGVEPLLDAQRAALARAQAQALEQRVRFGQDLHRAAGQQGQLIFGAHRSGAMRSPCRSSGPGPRILEGPSGARQPAAGRAPDGAAGARPAASRPRCRAVRSVLGSPPNADPHDDSPPWSMPPFAQPRRFPWRLFLSLVVVAVFGSAGATFGVVQWLRRDLPSPEQVTAVQTPVKTTVYDARGRVLHEFYKENRSPVALRQDPAPPRQRHAGDRGPELLQPLGRGPVGHRARRGQQRDAPARHAGRQHHHPAARPQPLPDPRAHADPQAQGGRPRDRAGARLLEGPDPGDVLQPDLLRGGRLRGGCGGAHLLRQADPAADAPRVRAARRDPGESEPLLPAPPAPGRARAAREGAAQHAGDARHHAGGVRPRHGRAAGRHAGPLEQRPRALLRRDGAPAPGRALRLERGLRGRAQGLDDARHGPAADRRARARPAALGARGPAEAALHARRLQPAPGPRRRHAAEHALPAERLRGPGHAHRLRPRAHRRPRLEPEQLQPRRAGAAAARLVVQALRLHGRHGQRLQAHRHRGGRAGLVPGRGGRQALRAPATTTASSAGPSPCATRCSSPSTSRPSSSCARWAWRRWRATRGAWGS